MSSLLQKLKLSALISQTLKCRRFSPHSHLSRPFIHTQPPSPSPTTDDDDKATVVKAICDSLRLGSNWDVLSDKFRNLDFDEPLVQRVLIELKDPTDAKRALGFFHWSAKRKGLEHGVGSYSIAIHISVRARMNLDAKALIESILKRIGSSSELSVVDSLLGSFWVVGGGGSNPFVFDLLVRCYSRLRMFRRGFEVCRYLNENGFCLSISSFNALLHVVENSGGDESCVGLAWEIYEHMVRVRVYPNESTVEILIGCLCKEGKLRERVEVLDRICGKRCSSPGVIVNTSLVLWIVEQGRVEEAMVLLKRMLMKNMVFDSIAFSLIVYAKVRLDEFDNARVVFDEMLKRGFRPNSFVHTVLIGAYCNEGRVDEAGSLVDDMERLGLKPYDETFNHLVQGYARVGQLEDGLRICERMSDMGFVPSCSAFNKMVGGLCRDGDVEKANSMLTVLMERRFSPNEATYNALIDGYGKRGDADEVLKLFYEMESKSLCPGPSVFSALVKSLCQAGKPKAAEKYLWIMKDRCLVDVDHRESLYETLISSYVEQGNTKNADRLRNKIGLES